MTQLLDLVPEVILSSDVLAEFRAEIDCAHWTDCSAESEPFADATHWGTTSGEAGNG